MLYEFMSFEKRREDTGWTDTPLISFRSIFVLGLWFH